MRNYETDSAEKTMALAQMLAKRLRAGDVLTLSGDLGAGKTTFVKGLAKGLHIQRNVNSPTFTLIKEYEGRLPLYHMDVYRLDSEEEDLGYDEYFDGDGVTVIEWAEKIANRLPEDRLHVKIQRTSENGRILVLEPIGIRFEKLCKELDDESIKP